MLQRQKQHIEHLIQSYAGTSLEPFPKAAPEYGLYTTQTHDGDTALALWRVLRDQVSSTGYWPVILGNRDHRNWHEEHLSHPYTRYKSPAQVVAEAEQLDATSWLRNELETMFEYDDEASLDDYREPLADSDDVPEPSTEFVLPYGYRLERSVSLITLALVPTTVSWHIPAHLKFGDYNACPEPAVHAAVLCRWEDQYGAEIVSIGCEIIELAVACPPDNSNAALALAYEQFAYCGDIVLQGVGTIDALAATLLNGTVWFFWWD